MADYREIEDPKELGRLNKILSAKLAKEFKTLKTRTIGWPKGSFSAEVRFLSTVGDNVFWWDRSLSDDKKAVNLFGHGAPGDNAMLNIDVQFNVPVVKFSRMSGGAFLREIKTGKIILAHRGIVTRGLGHIKKSALFFEMIATLRGADTSRGTQEFLLIGELDSPTLIDDIDTFSTELRRTVSTLRNKKQKRQPTLPKALSDYLDEFSGKRVIQGRLKIIADCYHGKVVRVLRDELANNSKVFKTREIDLIAFTDKKAFVFEVKTSTDNQAIYTAIGQLTVHAPAVAKHVNGKPLKRIIVLPEKPSKHLCTVLKDHLGIQILTFNRSTKGFITIEGLDLLK
ncbi:MAG: hypothetical protein HY955_06890 [Deltaproteobacteria bacterium]|nr:hypothetical protein [Deltaproteobacteria bacterium]